MLPRVYTTDNATGTQRTFRGRVNCAEKCFTKSALNGEITLELTTSVNDNTAGYLRSQRMIEAIVDFRLPPQLFIITKTERLINGKINVYGEHVKSLANQYITAGSTVYADENENVMENTNPFDVWNALIAEMTTMGLAVPPFTFGSDILTQADFSLGLTKPETFGDILGGKEGSFLDTWRGYFKFNNYEITYNRDIGIVQNFALRYGRNITDCKQTEEITNTYTHILPYGTVRDMATETDLTLVGNLTPIEHSQSDFRKVFLYDCSAKSKKLKVYSNSVGTHTAGEGFAEARTKMSGFAASYARSENLGSILAGITVTHRSELDEMKRLGLGDTVDIVLDNFGTSTRARITETELDVLNERWQSLTVGERQVTLSDLFIKYDKFIKR